MWSGELHPEFDRRTIPAFSKARNSFSAVLSLSGSSRRLFVRFEKSGMIHFKKNRFFRLEKGGFVRFEKSGFIRYSNGRLCASRSECYDSNRRVTNVGSTNLTLSKHGELLYTSIISRGWEYSVVYFPSWVWIKLLHLHYRCEERCGWRSPLLGGLQGHTFCNDDLMAYSLCIHINPLWVVFPIGRFFGRITQKRCGRILTEFPRNGRKGPKIIKWVV